jgi:hypothetical protein
MEHDGLTTVGGNPLANIKMVLYP